MPVRYAKSCLGCIFPYTFKQRRTIAQFLSRRSNSWCKYQNQVVEGSVETFRHSNKLPVAVMDAIKPVFNDLSQPKLLQKCLEVIDSLSPCPDKEPVLPRSNVNEIAANSRFLILSLSNNDMSKQSPFAIHKALIEIGGEPKSVKRLRSGDLLLETNSALQTKSFLLAKSFLDSPITISPHKTLNSCRGVISESDLLTTPDAEILDGFSDQGVIQANLLPSASSIKPTTKIASRLPKPISSAAAPDNNLNTSASSLSAETRTLIRSNKSAAALSTEIQPLPESDPTASNGEHFNAPEVPQCAKRNSRNREESVQ
ncbi:uncharacterized protein TNCV_5059411, partial [Trichonephila clavipes]